MDDKGCRKTPSLRVQTAPGLADELVPFLGRKITQDGNLDANREVDSSAVNCPRFFWSSPWKKKHGIHSSGWLDFCWFQPKSNKTKSAKRVNKNNKNTQTAMKHQQRGTKEVTKKSLNTNKKVTATKINKKQSTVSTCFFRFKVTWHWDQLRRSRFQPSKGHKTWIQSKVALQNLVDNSYKVIVCYSQVQVELSLHTGAAGINGASGTSLRANFIFCNFGFQHFIVDMSYDYKIFKGSGSSRGFVLQFQWTSISRIHG